MMGRSHLVATAAIVTTGTSWLELLSRPQAGVTATLDRVSAPLTGQSTFVSSAAQAAQDWMLPFGLHPLHLAGVTLMLALGSLWADMDHPRSLLGRHLHLSIAHRGITHTTWVSLVLLLASMADPSRLVFWFLIGSVCHNEIDGLSVAGRVRFYPLTSYKKVHLGPVPTIVSPRYGGLYTTGKTSERIMLAVLATLAAASLAALVLLS